MKRMKRMSKIVCSLVAMVAGVSPALANPGDEVHHFQSIDCRSDEGAAVNTICKSQHLRYIDEEIAVRLTRAYDQASLRDKARLLAEQRAFLAIRDGCGTDEGCIGDILHHRTDVIGAR